MRTSRAHRPACSLQLECPTDTLQGEMSLRAAKAVMRHWEKFEPARGR